MPCIPRSRALVLASALMWHGGEPFQPANSLKEEGRTTVVVPVAQQEQSTYWGWLGRGGEEGERHRGGMHHVGLGCLQLPTLVNTGPKNCP